MVKRVLQFFMGSSKAFMITVYSKRFSSGRWFKRKGKGHNEKAFNGGNDSWSGRF